MTSTDNASDPFLTEDANAPGKFQQGNHETWRALECGTRFHESDRYWNCDKQYLGWNEYNCSPPHAPYPQPPRTFQPYVDAVTYWQACLQTIPAYWCWCLQAHHTDYINDKLWDAQQRLTEYRRRIDNAVEYAKNGRERGPRELTLTYSPEWYDEDHLAQDAFRKAIERLIKYYRDELIEFRAVGEFTKAGRSHVHILYALSNGGKFTDKNLRRAYPHWDAKKRRGGHHSIVKSKSDFSGYLEKDLEDAWIDVTYPHADDNPQPQAPRGVLEGIHHDAQEQV